MKVFKPDLICDTFWDLSPEFLAKKGIKLLITDVDNTLVPHNYPVPTEEVKEYFDKLKDNGITICLMSNNSEERVLSFNRELGVDYIYKAGKPKKNGYIKAMKKAGTTIENTAALGDQLFTDIWGAKRAGVFTVMVKPISFEGENKFIAFKRMLEKFFI